MRSRFLGPWALAFAVLALTVPAQVVSHRCRVLLDVSPGPSEGSTRSQDANFEQVARVRAHLFAFSKPAAEVKVQFLWVYDEVNTSGKVDRHVEAQEQVAKIEGAGDVVVVGDPFRLSGKITKKGMLTGMRYVGCATRVYEGSKLVFEDYHPPAVREQAAKEPPPVLEARRELPAPPPEPPAAPPVPALKPAVPPSAASSSVPGDVVVMGSSFSPAEARAALEAVNQLSEEDLDKKVGLSKSAAQHLVEARPIKSLEDLPKVKFVKTTAIAALKKFVSSADEKR